MSDSDKPPQRFALILISKQTASPEAMLADLDRCMKPDVLKNKRPWLNGLITTTILAVVLTFSGQLWADGRPEWAFAVFFAGAWLLISIFWSNARYNEESGLILADIIDHNFREISDRIDQLEQRLADTARRSDPADRNAATPSDITSSGS